MLRNGFVLPLLALSVLSCGQSTTPVSSTSSQNVASPPAPSASVALAPAVSASAATVAAVAPEKPCGMPKSLPKPDWPKKLEPTTATEPDPIVAGTATIAVLPDTQYY